MSWLKALGLFTPITPMVLGGTDPRIVEQEREWREALAKRPVSSTPHCCGCHDDRDDYYGEVFGGWS